LFSFLVLSTNAVPAGQSWTLNDFSDVDDIYDAMDGVADTKSTAKYRSIVPDPLNPKRKVVAVFHGAGSYGSNSKGGTTVRTSLFADSL
jgi:hypothetical protein